MLLGQLSDVNCRSPIHVNQKLDITCAPDKSRGLLLDVLYIDCEQLDIIQYSVIAHTQATSTAVILFSVVYARSVLMSFLKSCSYCQGECRPRILFL